MSTDIGPRIGIDGEAEFRKQLTNINQQLKTLGTEMKAVTSAFDANDSSQEALAAQAGVLTRQIETQEQKLSQLQKGLEASAQKYGENDTRTLKWAAAVNNATADLNKMRAQLSKVEGEMDGTSDASDDLADGMEQAGDAADRSNGKFSAATVAIGNLASSAITAAVSAIGDLVSSLWNLDSSTEEYRIAQGRLNTAFEAAGYGADTAQQAYQAFYGILGDTDTATEASQLLAKLAESEEDVATWTNIAAGVSGTFGDSLPIEGLIEASNETAKVGQVTGVLADALNWAGINEDSFNERLAACSSESERNQLIMDALSGTYDEASDAFYRNNEALVESRMNQAKLDATLATLGQTVSDVKNRLLSEMLPTISQVVSSFSDMINGVAGADQEFSTAVQGMVTSVVSSLPQFLNFGVQIISSLVSGIVQSIPALVAAAPQAISSIVSALSELLPQVAETGMGLLRQFASGIESGLPEMAARLPEVINTFLNYITENLPSILDAGVEMLNSLVNGLIDAIPERFEALPEIITSFIQFITDNLPTIIDAGIDILLNLVSGIVDAIPRMVAALPDIISAFTGGIADAFPDIIESGVELLQKFWEGIASNIPELVSNLPEIIDAIIDGIGNLMGGIVDVGKNIVQGLLDGISSMGDWLTDQITSFCTGVLDGFLSFFGIASPSKVMRDQVGIMLARGVAVGMDNGIKYVEQTARDLGTAIEDEIARVNAEISRMEAEDTERQAAEELAAYQQSIKEKYAAAAEAEPTEKQKLLDEIAQMESDWNAQQTEEARRAEKDKAEARLKELEDFQKEYEAGLAEIEKSQESMAAKLSGYGELFSSTPDGLELDDLQGQIDQIEAYSAALEGLKDRGVSDSLMDEITGMSVDDAVAYTTELLSMTDDEYKKYMGLWEEKQQAAQEVAAKFYQDEMAVLEEEFVDKVPKAISGLKDGLYDVGQNSAAGLAEGLKSMQSYVSQSAVAIIENALAAARSAMGVHSPSTVWAGFGENLAAGVGVGFADEMRTVSRNMQQALPRPEDTLGNIAAGMVNGINTAMTGNTAPQSATIILEVNGRELARALVPDIRAVERSNPVVLSGV